MRLKKESMRQIADAGMVQRAADSIHNAATGDPFDRAAVKPRYFRGALVKPKQERKDGKQ